MTNSEARKRNQAAQTPQQPHQQPNAPGVDSPDVGRLTEDLERFENYLRWHFNVVAEEGKGSACIGLGIENAKLQLAAIVTAALAEVELRIWALRPDAALASPLSFRVAQRDALAIVRDYREGVGR